jgi:hypothetical protein
MNPQPQYVHCFSSHRFNALITPKYWCWIGQKYLPQRIFGEYLWLWLTLFFSFAAYVPLFFWARGNVIVGGDHWYSWSWQKSTHDANGRGDPHDGKRRSLDMIAYPLAYSLIVLPLCVVRWVGFSQEAHSQTMPSAATITVVALFGLSGAVNVVLFLSTRPDRLLFAKEPPMSAGEIEAHARGATESTYVKEERAAEHVETLGTLLSTSAGAWDPNPKSRPNTGGDFTEESANS